MGLTSSCFKQEGNEGSNENVYPGRYADSKSDDDYFDNRNMEWKMDGCQKPLLMLEDVFQNSIPDRERIPPPVIFRCPLRMRSWIDPFLPITVSGVTAGEWATSFRARCELIKDKMNGPLMNSETEIKEDEYRCDCKASSEYVSDVTDERVTSDEWCEGSPEVCKKCHLERVRVENGHCLGYSSDWINRCKTRKADEECFPSVYAQIKILESFRTRNTSSTKVTDGQDRNE